jgi:hypothetical protein
VLFFARRSKLADVGPKLSAGVEQTLMSLDGGSEHSGMIRQDGRSPELLAVAVEDESQERLPIDVRSSHVVLPDALGEGGVAVDHGQFTLEGVEQHDQRRETLLTVDDITSAQSSTESVLDLLRVWGAMENKRPGIVLTIGSEEL